MTVKATKITYLLNLVKFVFLHYFIKKEIIDHKSVMNVNCFIKITTDQEIKWNWYPFKFNIIINYDINYFLIKLPINK